MVDPAGDRPDPCDKSSAVAFGIEQNAAVQIGDGGVSDRPDPCDKAVS